MSELNRTIPVMISLSSHDPTGSTGVQADIETSFSLGVHCCPIITALCARDTRQLIDLQPTGASLLIEQMRAILEDMPVTAIKLGYFCQVEQIEAVHSILQDYPHIPVVLDPVLTLSIKTSSPTETSSERKLSDALVQLLLPLASITTPDIVEAQQLARQADSAAACAREMLAYNCDSVLITGVKRTEQHIINCFYRPSQPAREFRWPRVQQFSHGSGATLSASLSAYLAHGLLLTDAVEQAQLFTWNSLRASRRLGMGHCTPNRLFWCQNNH